MAALNIRSMPYAFPCLSCTPVLKGSPLSSPSLIHASCQIFSTEKLASQADHCNKMGSLWVEWKPRGGTLGISGWGCAAGTLEPLTYTRASSAKFCYPLLE